VRMHRKLRAAGVVADLHVLEAAPHGFFLGGTPEDEDLDREVRRFVETHCPPLHQTGGSEAAATSSVAG
jgi:epsilon-lactone hydrolase